MRNCLTTFALLLLTLALSASETPSVVLVILDDVGTDMLASYGEGPDPAITPNIDELAASGLVFEQAWSAPVCSPTRACILTGCWPERTGITNALGSDGAGSLDENLPTLAETLTNAGVLATCHGKWHLSVDEDPNHPNLVGFTHYAGLLSGSPRDYYTWLVTVIRFTLPTCSPPFSRCLHPRRRCPRSTASTSPPR